MLARRQVTQWIATTTVIARSPNDALSRSRKSFAHVAMQVASAGRPSATAAWRDHTRPASNAATVTACNASTTIVIECNGGVGTARVSRTIHQTLSAAIAKPTWPNTGE